VDNILRPLPLLRFLLLLSVMTSLYCAYVEPRRPTQVGLDVNVGKTVEISSSYRYCWYPTIHRFSAKDILVTMQMTPDEIDPEGQFSAYCVSRDGGLSWSRRYTMGAGAVVDGAYTQTPRPDGSHWVLGAGYASVEPFPANQSLRFHTTLTKYSRLGMEINQVRDATVVLREAAHFVDVSLFDRHTQEASNLKEVPDVTPWGAIIDELNGDLLTTLYYTTTQAPKRSRLVLLRSADAGRTWTECSVIPGLESSSQVPWMGEEGPTEAGLIRLADKRLYVIFRTGGNSFMGHAWSSDDGRTWTRPRSTGYKGVAPHVRRLSNGVLACTYGRPGPVSIMFSLEGTGEKWSNVTEIFGGQDTYKHRRNMRNSTRYADFVELQPGKLLVAYDSVPYGWDPIPDSDRSSRNAILGTFLDVRRK
jgi:BNR repeat-like domain